MVQINLPPVSNSENIAMILENTEKTQGYIHDVETSRPMVLAGYYLGQRIDKRQVLQCLASNPSEEAVSKLILVNLVNQFGGRSPNVTYRLEYVVSATIGAYVGKHVSDQLSDGLGLAARYGDEYRDVSDRSIFDRILGYNTDAKIIADDICHIMRKYGDKISSIKTFEDMVYAACACIYSDHLTDPERKKAVEDVITNSDYEPILMFELAASHFCASFVDDILKRDAPKIYSSHQKVADVSEQVLELIELECKPQHPALAAIAYEVDRAIGDGMQRVLVHSDGAGFEISHVLSELKSDKEIMEILSYAGLTNESDVDRLNHKMQNIRYRGVGLGENSDPGDFNDFLKGLPQRIMSSPRYDPNDKDFSIGDLVLPFHAKGIIRYAHHGERFDLDSFPLGTVCKVVSSRGNTIDVMKDDDPKVYQFESDEIAKVILNTTTETSELKELMISMVGEHQIDMIRLKAGYTFKEERFRDALRFAILTLYESGLPIPHIKDIIAVEETGLSDYAKSRDIDEWKLKGGLDVTRENRPLSSSPVTRVYDILSRRPGIFEFSNLDKDRGSTAERSLAYLLCATPESEYLKQFLGTEDPVRKYIMSMLSVEHTNDNDPARILGNSNQYLCDIMDRCAVYVFQTLSGVRGKSDHRGMDRSNLAHMRGDPMMEMLEVLRETNERESPSGRPEWLGQGPSLVDPEDILGLIARGEFSLIPGPLGEQMGILDRKVCDARPDEGLLYHFKLFQDIKGNIDETGAARLYMEHISGFEDLAKTAYTIKDLRYLLGFTTFMQALKHSPKLEISTEGKSCHELFIESALNYVLMRLK